DGGPAAPPADGTDLARGKPVEATSAAQNYVATNANDGDTGTYWESAGFPASLTVKLGADADVSAVVLKLNPDEIWGPRTQSLQIRGRAQGADEFSTLKARADYAFSPAEDSNTVTVPVTGRVSDLRLTGFANSGAPGVQVAEIQVIGTAAPAPDLVVTGLTWTPEKPSEKDEITAEVTVRNAGSEPAPATTVDVSVEGTVAGSAPVPADRKSTRLNSSHVKISYAVFCLKKKKNKVPQPPHEPSTQQQCHREDPWGTGGLGKPCYGDYCNARATS